MILAIILVSINGLIPAPLAVQAMEKTKTQEIVLPIISKDVEGENSKEIQLETDYLYHINVQLPDDVSTYEVVEISDELDQRLAVRDATVSIGEKADSSFKTVVDNQSVSLKLDKEEIEKLASKELQLQITAQVIETKVAGEEIENVAQIMVNNDLVIKSDPAIVIPVGLEKADQQDTALQEVKHDPASKDAKEEDEQEGTENSKNTKAEDETAVIKEKKESDDRKISIQAEEFTVNDVDSYGIQGRTLYQFDGNNPSTTPKASIPITGISGTEGLNGLALSIEENAFYASFQGQKLYRIDASGKAELFATLEGSAGNAVIYNGKYYYTYGDNGKSFLASIDLNTGEQSSAEIEGLEARGSDLGGDIVIDSDGYIWFYMPQPTRVVQLDPSTAQELRNVPITNADGVEIEWGARGISFLPSGEMLLAGGLNNPKFYILDPETKSTTYLGAMTGKPIYDLASGTWPQFEPNPPELESEKTAEIQEKAAGNSKTDHPEEGDTLLYTIQTRNTIEDSIVKNLVISDKIPEGLKYITGTLKVDDNPVSDDDDQGDYSDTKVTGKFGDITDTDWHTVTFEVVVEKGQAGKTVENTALVDGDNLDDPDEPDTSIDVDPKDPEPIDSCTAPVALVNGSFEEPAYSPDDSRFETHPGWFDAPQDTVPGWQTTDQNGILEIMNKSLGDEIEPGSRYDNLKVTPAHGQQFAELNSLEAAQLYQDVKTTPGQTIYWRLAHKGRAGEDTMALNIDSANVAPEDLKTVETMTSGKEEWQYYSGTYVVPEGQTTTRFGFEAISSSTGKVKDGNFLDDIFLGTPPCMTAEKTVSPEDEVFIGNELTYEITVKNAGGDVAGDTVIEDAIPEGTEYVPRSMKIVSGPNAGDLTDEEDDDQGYFDDEKVIFSIGDLPNTTELPDGVTVQFKVKTLSSHIGKDVVNQGKVKYKDLLTGDDKETDTNETKTPVKNSDPDLESEKSAQIETKAEGNTDQENPEVGDTLRYTIRTHNTIKDSIVENLVISDEIPAGLDYVKDSLTVDGKAVTDAKDDDSGHYVNGKVIGHFGDINDTDWHSVEFLVTVAEGQAGQDIKNVAEVDGDNIDDPDEPEEEVIIYPRDPDLESEKSAANAEKGKKKYEIGDTVVYTIKTHNIVSDSTVENLTITDTLPDGLEYVKGSLKVSNDGKGSFADGQITATFGDITDTEWRTITFETIIKSSQVGKNIDNIATVDGDNINEPDEPNEEITIEPTDPILESKKVATNAENDKEQYEVGDTVVYTIKARNTISDSTIKNLAISDTLPDGLEYLDGSLKVSHDGNGKFKNGQIITHFGDVKDTEWRTVTFEAKIKSSQAGQTIKNIAVVDGDNIEDSENPVEEIKVNPKDPKDLDPTTPSDLKDNEGKQLPKTAAEIFNYLLLGMGAILIGILFLRRKTSSNE